MAKKMYYSEEEATSKLGVSEDELQEMVRENKLKVFPDGQKKMFKAEEVDALAGDGGEDVELAPADEADLSDADAERPATKEDTVISAEGISIFDDEDLEIEADPMAKTQIAPSLEDQIALDGVGSGSGLLDLTRESDDTSLGAEVLDHIDIEGGVGSGIEAGAEPEPEPYAPQQQVVQPTFVEQPDASAGFFRGMAIGAAIVSFVLLLAAVGAVYAGRTGTGLALVSQLKENLLIVLGGGLVAIIVIGIIGFVVGKSAADRQTAMQRMGG